MPRPNKPWFRAATDWWMVKIDGRQMKLAKGKKNKTAALKKFHELMAARTELPESVDARIADVCEAFLGFSSKNHAPDTYRNYRFYIQSFCDTSGLLPVLELRQFHVSRWIEAKEWNETSRHNGRRFVFRAFSWAVGEGILEKNPLAGMKKGKPKPRKRALTDEEYLSLIRATDGCFRAFLFALRQTGARPKELRTLTWEQVREDRLVLWEHKTDEATEAPRVIYLNEPMQKMMLVLRKRSNSDHVFLNSRGRPWTTNAVRQRIQLLREKLGLANDVCAYLFRHTFGTNAVMNGVDIATVAELMGHSSTEMVNKVYLHLADQQSHLQSAIEKATARKAS